MSEGFVVAGEPLLGADHTSVDVVSHEVLKHFGRVPLDKHRGLGVPGGDNLSWGRGNA